MPQLDFSVFPSQFFWLSVSFLLMLFIMSKFIIPKTAEMINLRKEKIDGDLERAAEIKLEVEKTLQKYNDALAKANAKAKISLQKTKDDLNETINLKQQDLALKLRAEVEKKIADTKAKTLAKIDDVAAQLSIDVLNKLGFGGIKLKDTKAALKTLEKD